MLVDHMTPNPSLILLTQVQKKGHPYKMQWSSFSSFSCDPKRLHLWCPLDEDTDLFLCYFNSSWVLADCRFEYCWNQLESVMHNRNLKEAYRALLPHKWILFLRSYRCVFDLLWSTYNSSTTPFSHHLVSSLFVAAKFLCGLRLYWVWCIGFVLLCKCIWTQVTVALEACHHCMSEHMPILRNSHSKLWKHY